MKTLRVIVPFVFLCSSVTAANAQKAYETFHYSGMSGKTKVQLLLTDGYFLGSKVILRQGGKQPLVLAPVGGDDPENGYRFEGRDLQVPLAFMIGDFIDADGLPLDTLIGEFSEGGRTEKIRLVRKKED